MFEVLDFFSQGFGGVVRAHQDFSLKDSLAVVIKLVDVMDGDPAFFFTCCDDRFVNVASIHPFAAIFG